MMSWTNRNGEERGEERVEVFDHKSLSGLSLAIYFCMSEEERGEAGREVREGEWTKNTHTQRHRPMNCGTSFSELMAALKKASPGVVVNGERHTHTVVLQMNG